jgi:hypothetical protein
MTHDERGEAQAEWRIDILKVQTMLVAKDEEIARLTAELEFIRRAYRFAIARAEGKG